MPHFLTDVHLQGIRGIENISVTFEYPVSVIAGGNASGKTTVLFAAACAYKVPGSGVKDFVPSTLFPDYRPKVGTRKDGGNVIVVAFDYSTPTGRMQMRWRRAKGWNRSFFGRPNSTQPERPVYLRTLSNLSNPAEVRGVLSLSRTKIELEETPLNPSQRGFAQQMLPFRYSEVVDLSSGNKKLLFASQEGGAEYSELHMAAGERAILRLSQEIAQLEGALVLIDEVEAGLHPWVQKLLLLQLQQLAIRNDLQIIVTTHSPAVLDSVPAIARIFLERDEAGKVTVRPPYRDLVQDALYGRARETLKILCEDEIAEGLLLGVLDYLRPGESIPADSIRIEHDTGATEFPAHAKAFSTFGVIAGFVFVLDGDMRESELENKIQRSANEFVPVLYLPSLNAPEVWLWDTLRNVHFEEFGYDKDRFFALLNRSDAIYDSASYSEAERAKSKIQHLSTQLSLEPPTLCRIVARNEAGRKESEIQLLVEGLKDALERWRSENGK